MSKLYVPRYLSEAIKCKGIVEGPGAANNPAVVKFYAEAGHPEIKHDDVAWCAAYVGAMLARGGEKNTGSLAARSYETFGTKLHKPVFGCIGVKKRKGGGWLGHVGFVVGFNGSRVYMLGGNQGDQVSVASFPASEFTAFVLPPGQDVAKFSPAPLSPPADLKAVAGAVSEA